MDVGLSGQFSQSRYVQLIRAIEVSSLSGELQINSGRIERKIQFVDGQLVGYSSNFHEDKLAQTLLEQKVINAKALRWHEQHLNDDTSLAQSLVESGVIEQSDLVGHQLFRIERGVASLLGLKAGSWQFVSMPWVSREVLSVSIAPNILTIETLWKGVQEKLTAVELSQMIPISPTQSFQFVYRTADILHQTDINNSITALLEAGGETDLEKLVSLAPQNSEDILRLVWLLYHYGALDCASDYNALVQDLIRSKPMTRDIPEVSLEASTEPGNKDGEVTEKRSARLRRLRKQRRTQKRSESSDSTEPPRPEVDAQPTSSASSKSDWVKSEYSSRVGLDYYRFAGLSQADAYTKIDRVIKGRLKKWVIADRSGELDEASKLQCKVLIKIMRKVHKVLVNPEKRSAYDKQLSEGNAPMAQVEAEPEVPEVEANIFHDIPERVVQLIEAERFSDVLPILKHLRFENPSSVEILTYLGWSIWKVEQNAQSAREWLQMALTFDGSRVDAIGFLGRIALAAGEVDNAKRYLRRVLQINPNEAWARVAFDDLNKST